MFGQGFNYGFLGKPPCFTDTTDIFKDNSGVALYTLDYDASDSGNATGKFGEAAIFNGSSGRIHINNLTIPSTTSISMWVKPSNITTNSTVFTSQTSDYRREYPSLIWFPTSSAYNGFAAIYTQSGGYIGSSSIASANEWHHVVCIKNSDGSGSMYVDNSLIGSVSANTTHPQSSGFTLGCNYEPESGGFKSFFDGQIDQVRIFNKAISPTEVATLYNETKATVDTLQVLGDATCISTYPLDGSSTDLSGNYNGTDTNILYKYDGTSTNVDFGVGGKSLYGARFNGSSSTIQLSGGNMGLAFGSSASYSISFWFNTSNASTWQRVFNTCGAGGNSANQIAASLYLSKLYIYRRTGTSTSVQTLNSSALQSNTWYNTVLTVDGSSVKLYLNGVEETLTVSGSTVISSVSNIIFGSHGYTPYFNGSMDQIRVFNKALSSSEVSKLYGNGAGEIACAYTATTTDVNYPVANTAYYKLDNSSKDSARSTGKFNEGAIFNGSSSKIESNILQSTNMTFSFWFQTETVGEREYLMGFNTSGSAGYINTRLNANDTIGIVYWNGSTYAAVSSSAITRDTNYNHICITISGTSYSIYYNGNSLGSGALSGFSASSRTDFVMGFDTPSGSGGYMNGSLDQVRLFNVALSSADVSNLYAETASDTNTLSFPSGQTAIATYQLDGNSTDLSGNYNGTDTNIAYAYDGTDTNVEYRFGRFGQAAVFNGGSSKITPPVSTSIAQQNNYTFSAWFKTDTTGVMQTIYAFNSPSTFQSAIFIHSNGTNNIRIFSAGSNYYSSNNVYTNNQWYHIAVTKSSANGIVAYLDGNVIINEPTATANNTQPSAGDNRIGGYKTSAESLWFDGSIDQVRIYSTALDSDQVTKLYNEKPKTDTSNFKTVLYEGTGSTQYISNVGFNLDVDNGGDGGLVWIKRRDSVNNHSLYDTIRGAQQELISNLTNADTLDTDALTSFDANGFFLGADGNVNPSSSEFVAWVWKGGGDAVAGSSSQATNVSYSANTEAGFSIVKFTSSTSTSQPPPMNYISHGLNSPVEMTIYKRLDIAQSWTVQHKDLDQAQAVYLDLSNAAGTPNPTYSFFDNTSQTGSIGVRSNFAITRGAPYISYCFHSVAGYSKIGTYTGNNPTKVTVTLGFRPSWIMIKSTSHAYGWWMLDNKRSPTGNWDDYLYANTSAAEGVTGGNWIKPTDNGFETNATGGSVTNMNGVNYIYMAFK